jgi:uncharacterized damage-inducible protein DinB
MHRRLVAHRHLEVVRDRRSWSELGGQLLPRATWQNIPRDIEHFLTYFVAHEAHHRGQLILITRQLGHRLPRAVSEGVWQWNRMSRESR